MSILNVSVLSLGLMVGGGSVFADDAKVGGVKGQGEVRGGAGLVGNGEASGKGIVVGRNADGTIRMKRGSGTVEGRGVAIGKGEAGGRGIGGGKGMFRGRGRTVTPDALKK